MQSQIIWNSRDSSIKGFALSSDDLKSLHDVYEGLNSEEACQKTAYILQFLWRDLTSNFDVVGPYFTLPSTIEAKQLHAYLTDTMTIFHHYGFHIRGLVCDGASSNLALLKTLCSIKEDAAELLTPRFTSPLDGKSVYAIICPSHQVNITICACVLIIVIILFFYLYVAEEHDSGPL